MIIVDRTGWRLEGALDECVYEFGWIVVVDDQIVGRTVTDAVGAERFIGRNQRNLDDVAVLLVVVDKLVFVVSSCR